MSKLTDTSLTGEDLAMLQTMAQADNLSDVNEAIGLRQTRELKL